MAPPTTYNGIRIGKVVKPPAITAGPGGNKGPRPWSSPVWGSPTPTQGSRINEPHGTTFAPPQAAPPAPKLLTPATAAAPVSSSTPGPPASPSPLDSTYFANVAANQFGVNNKINELNTQGGLADTALQTTLGNLAYQEPRDQLKAEQSANSRGGLYSTVYNQQLGDLTHGYQERQSAAQTSHDNGALQRAAQIAALQGGIPLYNDQQAAAAAVRAANLNAANKALGEPSGSLTKTPQSSPSQQLAAALAAAQKTGKTQTTRVDGQIVSSYPSGLQQSSRTKGGMFGGTVRLPPNTMGGLAKVAQLMAQGMTQAQAMQAIGAK